MNLGSDLRFISQSDDKDHKKTVLKKPAGKICKPINKKMSREELMKTLNSEPWRDYWAGSDPVAHLSTMYISEPRRTPWVGRA